MADEGINPPPSIPPYTEMIFAAVDALKEKEGVSESSISTYIESTCGSLPEDHNNILADQLKKMVEDGELVLLNNNYARPDTIVPAKRGRGRPPKPKDPVGSDSGTQTQADTQGPVLEVDPASEPASAQPGSERRGRPKKDPPHRLRKRRRHRF